MYNERVVEENLAWENLVGKNREPEGISKIAWMGQKIKI
jgi:hypothetical protein